MDDVALGTARLRKIVWDIAGLMQQCEVIRGSGARCFPSRDVGTRDFVSEVEGVALLRFLDFPLNVRDLKEKKVLSIQGGLSC